MKRFFWWGIPLALLAAIALYPPARLATYVLIGRGTNCTFERAIRSGTELDTQIRYKDEILNATRLLESDDDGYKKFRTPMGDYWIPAKQKEAEYVLPYNLAEQKRGIYFDGDHTIRAGDVVLDCGANIGVFTRTALDLGASKVIAIEPAPENIECLRRNFPKEIAAGTVVLVPKGVWHQEDELTLNVDPANPAADSFVMTPKGSTPSEVKMPLTTIDLLVEELGLTDVDFIKMDIEGAEPNAIDGSRQTLQRFKPRLSLSAYHAEDHPVVVPEKVNAARDDYAMRCGPCAEVRFGVRPDILYFY